MTLFYHRENPAAVIRVTGEDATPYLQSQWTIDLEKLPIPGTRYGLRLNLKGKVTAGARIIKFSEEEYLLVSRGTDESFLLPLLEENVIADEVEFKKETENWSWISVWGEESDGWLDRISPEIRTMESNCPITGDGWIGFADSRLPKNFYSLILEREDKNPWNLSEDGIEVTRETFDCLRIEAEKVAVPSEIGPEDLPQEGRLELDCVDFDKGCYLGQEVMARIHAMGRVRRRAWVVRWEGEGFTSLPVSLLASGKPVGSLRSQVRKDNGSIGIALIHENAEAELTEEGLQIEGRPERVLPAL